MCKLTFSCLIFSSMSDLAGSSTFPLHISANHLACNSDMVRTPPDAGCTKPMNARDDPTSGLNTFLYNCKYMTGLMIRLRLFVCFDSLSPINNLSVKQGRLFLG